VNPPKRAHNSEFTLKKQTAIAYFGACTRLYKAMPFCFDSHPFWGVSNTPAALIKVSAVLIGKLEILIIEHHNSADH